MQHIAIIAVETADSRKRSDLIILWRAARAVHARIASGVRFRCGHKSFLSIWYPQLPSNKP